MQFDFSKSLVKDSDIERLSKKAVKVCQILEQERKFKEVGFWDLPFQTEGLKNIQKISAEFGKCFKNLIVLGIGGSSLGLKCLAQALGQRKSAMQLYIQESPDPWSVQNLLDRCDLSQTAIQVISKSGKTPEILAVWDVLKKVLQKKVGSKWRDHIVITTEVGKGALYQEAIEQKLIHLEIPKNVGGRFSVFSSVGLFGLACIGVDCEKLLEGARSAATQTESEKNVLIHYLLLENKKKTISVMMTYGERFKNFGRWYAQLWAESLGKEGRGQTPLVAFGPQDQHSLAQLFLDGPKDKVVTFIKAANQDKSQLSELLEKEYQATAQALYESGVPSTTITLPIIDEETMGHLLMSYQIQTVFMGHLLGVNPYNQPAVEKIKNLL